ncbi:hypothetical protein [Streptomyces chiangmaiensis]|uniref:Tail fiber protein n=1 Tax=Streptomyces chiangmaiensis TaxID=766497 RepID=A0ABU7FFQ1_9ACTN|nr:hypothetical protein [Streptomyces chiangmaiensis]MED7822972.1 hypothetical protein [Streptomyces chiangmaiensis]
MAIQYTPISNLPYPQASDPADLPAHLKALADAMDARAVLRFADAAARDAKVTAPVAGMLAWIGTPGRLMYYTGTAWVPAAPSPVYKINVDAGDTTSATYVETLNNAVGDPMNASFTAPASGQVLITVGGYLWSSTANYSSFMSANVRNSAGTIVLAADDNRSALVNSTSKASVSTQFLVTGLAAGTTHTATPAYRSGVTTNTANFDSRFIRIDPIP